MLQKLNAAGKRIARRANSLLEPLEGIDTAASYPPPVLIIGAPRSGTTLLYQLLVQQFAVTYLSNIHHLVFGAPVLVERLVPQALRNPPRAHESRFGRVRGLWAPSEAANFWYRFFPLRPHAIQAGDVSVDRGRSLRNAIAALSRAAGAPMVSKNVVCSVRVEAIAEYVPEMRFLVMHREHLEVARSILAARMAVHGNYTDWWSVEPANVGDLRLLPPEQQVVEQVHAIEAAIERARRRLGPDRFVDINFSELTQSPRDVLLRLAGNLGLSPRRDAPPVPAAFSRATSPQLEPELFNRLVDYLNA